MPPKPKPQNSELKFFKMIGTCPYCKKETEMSKDHIFPAFFGGRTTISACSDCNNRFGFDFEAEFINDDFTHMVVIAGINGIKPQKTTVWKNAYTHEGIRYNLDSNNVSSTDIQIIKNADGKFAGIIGIKGTKNLNKQSRSLQGKGKKITMIKKTITVKKDFLQPKITLGKASQRLCVKMCLGLMRYFSIPDVTSTMTREFLLKGMAEEIPVRWGYIQYDSLDLLRPKLAHTIYVEGNNENKICYGILQFYGSFQLYVILNSNYAGANFSLVGTHNPITHEEKFDKDKYLNLEQPSLYITPEILAKWEEKMLSKFNEQLKNIFQKPTLTFKV